MAGGSLALEDKIVVISPHWEGIQREFERGFREYTLRRFGKEVGIEWLDVGGTSEVLRFLKSEFSKRPEGVGIDVMFGGGIDPYMELSRLDLLQPYRLPDSLLSRIAPEIGGSPVYDPQYRWYGATLDGFGIIYHIAVLDIIGLPEPGQGRPVPAVLGIVNRDAAYLGGYPGEQGIGKAVGLKQVQAG